MSASPLSLVPLPSPESNPPRPRLPSPASLSSVEPKASGIGGEREESGQSVGRRRRQRLTEARLFPCFLLACLHCGADDGAAIIFARRRMRTCEGGREIYEASEALLPSTNGWLRFALHADDRGSFTISRKVFIIRHHSNDVDLSDYLVRPFPCS